MYCFTISNILINIYFLIFINKFNKYKWINISFYKIKYLDIYLFFEFIYLFIYLLLTTSPRLGGGSLGSLVVTTFHPFGTKKLEVGDLVELGNVWLDLAVVQKWLKCLDMALAGVS